MKTIGYTLGPRYAEVRGSFEKPKPVKELPLESARLKKRLAQKKASFTRLLEQLSQIEKSLIELTSQCTHSVFNDEAAFLYDHRICLICGQCIDQL